MNPLLSSFSRAGNEIVPRPLGQLFRGAKTLDYLYYLCINEGGQYVRIYQDRRGRPDEALLELGTTSDGVDLVPIATHIAVHEVYRKSEPPVLGFLRASFSFVFDGEHLVSIKGAPSGEFACRRFAEHK